MSDVVYRSNVRIVRQRGADRLAWLPARDEPVAFGVHSAVASHYGIEPEHETATTLDFVIAAAGG